MNYFDEKENLGRMSNASKSNSNIIHRGQLNRDITFASNFGHGKLLDRHGKTLKRYLISD